MASQRDLAQKKGEGHVTPSYLLHFQRQHVRRLDDPHFSQHRTPDGLHSGPLGLRFQRRTRRPGSVAWCLTVQSLWTSPNVRETFERRATDGAFLASQMPPDQFLLRRRSRAAPRDCQSMNGPPRMKFPQRQPRTRCKVSTSNDFFCENLLSFRSLNRWHPSEGLGLCLVSSSPVRASWQIYIQFEAPRSTVQPSLRSTPLRVQRP